MSRRDGIPKDFIFRPEAAERNDAADRQPTSEKSQVRVRHVLLQATHPPHVLFVMHAVNHTARSEEHQGFEESMCDDVKDADDEGAHTASEKHKAKLRYGRVSQHALNIVLRNANRRRKD